MIVVSAGMPKSGTGWYYNLTNDLLVAAGHQDARQVRDEYQLHPILRAANCNVRQLRRSKLERLDAVSREGKTFVVKTHRRPSRALKELVAEGRFKATYIYRDIRDVIVSALDRGEAMRTQGALKGRHFFIGPYRSFAKLKNVRWAVAWARWRVMPSFRAYKRWDGVMFARYEDLLTDALGELKRLAAHLEIDLPEARLQEIVDKYRRDRFKGNPKGKGLHLHKGVAGRFQTALSAEQQEYAMKRLAPALREMGYLTDGQSR
ncbi:MAG: sulfotransferase domain-containing protein [Planctomycetota bacterium]|jgi:hypothetical protein